MPCRRGTGLCCTIEYDQEMVTLGRHDRRQNAALFRRNAVGGLETFLCAPDDVRLRGAPRLQLTVAQFLDILSARARFCMVCSSSLHDRHEVGMVLIAAPISSRPSSASCCGVCKGCTDADLPIEALEKAATVALREAIPNGRLAPLGRR